MTDRGAEALRQSERALTIGSSRMEWDGTCLEVHVDEIAVPRFDRLRGVVRVHPSALTSVEMPLTSDGSHLWRPFAPTADIEVEFDRPGWRWRGHGYFDANFGTRALEADFRTWTWSRLRRSRDTLCLYDVQRREGTALAATLRFDRDGKAQILQVPPLARLPRSRWGLGRSTRADPGTRPAQVRPMLDAPFYCRSALRSTVGGETGVGVHEALDLDRFSLPWLKPMLALRVPRRRRWRDHAADG